MRKYIRMYKTANIDSEGKRNIRRVTRKTISGENVQTTNIDMLRRNALSDELKNTKSGVTKNDTDADKEVKYDEFRQE